MIFLIKLILLIIYTVFVFRIGREYQIQKTIDFVEKQLNKRGTSIEEELRKSETDE